MGIAMKFLSAQKAFITPMNNRHACLVLEAVFIVWLLNIAINANNPYIFSRDNAELSAH